MASVAVEPNGRRRILFTATDRTRKTIRLGNATAKQALAIKVKVEQLISAKSTGVMDDEVHRWLGNLDEVLYGKLAGVGLVTPRASVRLAGFLDDYIASRQDVKPATAIVYGHTRRCLVDFFGPDMAIRDISAGDADRWRIHLASSGLSDNTVRRRCGIAKQFLRAAFRRKLVPANPFDDLRCSVQGNAKRSYFLSRTDAQKVLDACPDAEWRLLFGLSRYGGLRCPSEHLALRWSDVDWDKACITVHSPKTEHHEGGESRLIPLFPELLPLLRDSFEQAEPGTEWVIQKCRDPRVNLRTHMHRIIRRAGLIPWPKLFQNLRATRETELAESWPEHIVCAWIGNSRLVARKHYLQVTEDHMKRAASGAPGVAQIAAQQPAETPRTATHQPQASGVFPPETAVCEPVQFKCGPEWTRTIDLTVISGAL